jgi:hypothetical protein
MAEKNIPAPGQHGDNQASFYRHTNPVGQGTPSVWESFAVQTLAYFVSSTAETVKCAIARRGLTAKAFPRLYQPAFEVLLGGVLELLETGRGQETVNIVQFGQRLHERQGSVSAQVMRKITGSDCYSDGKALCFAELGLINVAACLLVEQAGFAALVQAQAGIQRCLDEATLVGTGEVVDRVLYAQAAGQRALINGQQVRAYPPAQGVA